MNQIQICNLAIDRLSGQSIQSLTENTREAELLNRAWTPALEATMTARLWSFARREATLAVVSDATSEEWTYVYALPSQCLYIRRVANLANDNAEVEYSLGATQDGSQRTLLCDTDGVTVIYTAKVTNTQLMPPYFTDCLAWRLASEIAYALTGDANMVEYANGMYSQALTRAATVGAKEEHIRNDQTCKYTNVRTL